MAGHVADQVAGHVADQVAGHVEDQVAVQRQPYEELLHTTTRHYISELWRKLAGRWWRGLGSY